MSQKLTSDERQAFEAACEQGDLVVVSAFLARQLARQLPTWQLYSYVDKAIEHNQPEIVRLLLGSLYIDSEDLGRMLITATESGAHAIMRLLIEHGADLTHMREERGTALTVAAARGDLTAVDMLLQAGADPNLRNTSLHGGDLLPLGYAVRNGHVEVVHLLIAAGANVNALDSNLHKPLDIAVQVGDPDLIALLEAAGATRCTGADLNIEQAVSVGDAARMQELLPGATPEERGAALVVATLAQAETIAACILTAPVDQANLDRSLFYAAQAGAAALVQALLTAGADLTSWEPYTGYTPWHSAAYHGHLDAVRHLRAAGADLDLRSRDRDTALTLAAGAGRLEVVRYLIEQGADLNLIDGEGKSALDQARSWDHAAIAELLQAHGARSGRVAQALRKALQPFKRTAFLPRTRRGDPALTASKFGGTPCLSPDEGWPRCPTCGQALTFFFQIDLNTLPDPLAGTFGSGLLQLFYCLDCAPWRPFAAEQCVRVVPTPEIAPNPPAVFATFPAKTITGWSKRNDFPYREVGPESWRVVQVDLPLTGDALDQMLWEDNLAGDKLGGWPNWVQDAGYPPCPECGQPMDRLVFQVDSQCNLPHMWGDNGVGFVVQCPHHPNAVTFFWQCA